MKQLPAATPARTTPRFQALGWEKVDDRTEIIAGVLPGERVAAAGW
ncbi:MAG: hypothetical protein IT429_15090 [Gemmataceae bacterium]|nr:hypothetical protein [Gemmataceae bacterium]